MSATRIIAILVLLATPDQVMFGVGAVVRDRRTNEGTVVAHKPTAADAIHDAKLAVGCGDDCEVLRTFSNECAAYAMDDSSKNIFASETAATYNAAAEAAVEQCVARGGSCRVMQTECDK